MGEMDAARLRVFQPTPQGRLRQQIDNHFNGAELRQLCQDLGIDVENLAGETRAARVQSLIELCEREGRLADLLAGCGAKRPFLTWSWNTFSQPEPPSLDLIAATNRYLHYLLTRYEYLDLHGMGVNGRLPIRLPLLDMFVPLHGRLDLPDGDTWEREDEATADSDPQPLLDLLHRHDGLIVLGDPGSGKTTFLKYLALQLAQGNGAALGLENWLPIVLPLAAYANALTEGDLPLSDFFVRYYQQRGLDLPLAAILSASLPQGGVLFLLDGLDEVQDVARRRLVVSRVLDFFTFQRQSGSKFVLTSRLVGYREVRQLVDGLVECTLLDLDGAAIEAFVTKWRGATGEGEAVLTAVSQNPAVARLAANPLLLTILLLMAGQGMVLPAQRVVLYAQCVRTLLQFWQLARGLDRPLPPQFDLAALLRLLPRLALWMQQTSPGVGLVGERPLLRQLTAIYREEGAADPTGAAQTLLTAVREYASLLVERGPGEFGFVHRTFQEYLTAVAVAQQPPDEVVGQLAGWAGQDEWHEVGLLTVAYVAIMQQDAVAAVTILQGLLAGGAAAVLLAGQAVADVGRGALGVGDEVETAVVAAVTTLLEDAQIEPVLRVASGQTLGQLGDGRTAVVALDAMPFCFVPAGEFWMGERQRAVHLLDLPYHYWLGQYPVSNVQFAEFVAAGGYEMAELWPEAASVGRWRAGEVQDWESRGWRKRPFDYGEPFNLPNHPVVGLNWFEALAFGRWLNGRWQAAGWLPEGWHVVLPSEAEWEKAARGGLQVPMQPIVQSISVLMPQPAFDCRENPLPQRRFSWGDKIDGNRANFAAAHQVPSSPGCFAAGRSPVGCVEMGGNVWEWTRSLHRPYPYVAGDGREETAVKLHDSLVLRGGAFWTAEKLIGCSSRSRRAPHDRSNSYGFRLAIRQLAICQLAICQMTVMKTG